MPHMTKEMCEEYVGKMKMALAEAGYPDAVIKIKEIADDFEAVSGWGPEIVPRSINFNVQASYNALYICAPSEFRSVMPCPACFEQDPNGVLGISFECVKGNCSA